MSFSSKTKNELCHMEDHTTCCLLAELAGIICFAAIIKDTESESTLKINTENASVARRIFALIKQVFGVHTVLTIRNAKTKKGIHQYNLVLDSKESLYTVLDSLKLLDGKLLRFRIHNSLIQRTCCRKAMIRGAFLGGGSITDPESTYHLEIVTHHLLLSKNLTDLLQSFGLEAKYILRKSNHVIYFKDSEAIVDFLRIISASHALMALENIRILKEMRNNVNRIVNCETANLEKTINASFVQIDGIKKIQRTIGIDKLPKNLQEIARLRLAYTDETLKELGEMLNPPIGKSGVNHRLRKLMAIADCLEG
ncbi:MAG: DNA-binding protein WhiA [Hyphomonadaceae bacterium]|nr:DNA-binding protein WhiA [Clostridia bacterium]